MRLSRRNYLGAGAAFAAGCLFPRSSHAASDMPCPLLRRGVGVHHLLNWPEVIRSTRGLQYVQPPFGGASYRISDAELAALKQTGFDFIRLTADPSIFIVTRADQQRRELEDHAKSTVDQLLKAGFNVIFDLHPVAVNPDYAPEALVGTNPDIFSAYVEAVGRIAAMLQPFPPERVALELFNEPWIDDFSQAKRWQGMIEHLHARARQVDPVRPLVLNGLHWDSVEGLVALDVRPFKDSNVLYTFHYYEPHAFTHQGVRGDTQWLSGLKWPENDDNARAVLENALSHVEHAAADARDRARADTQYYINALLRDHPGAAKIEKDFQSVTRWAAANKIPTDRIVLGEFGCVSSAGGHALGADRLNWLRTVRLTSEKAGFGWAYWAYKGNGGMTLVKGGVLDPETLDGLGLHKN